MSEEMIDIEANLGKEMADKINKMSKQQLIEALCVSTLRNQVQDDTVDHLEGKIGRLENKTIRNNNSINQAQQMIGALMDTW